MQHLPWPDYLFFGASPIGSYEEAIKCYGIQGDVTYEYEDVHIYLRKALDLYEQGEQEKAIKFVDMLTQLKPNDIFAWNIKAKIMVKLGLSFSMI